MKVLCPLTLLLLLLATPASAQKGVYHHVSPTGYAGVEGQGNNSWPFHRVYRKFSYQQVHDDLPARSMAITEIALRRDGLVPLPTYPAYKATLTLVLSTGAAPSAQATTGFFANHGPDRTVVLKQQTISFPPTTLPPTPPAPFDLAIGFSNKPFLYKGRTAGSLVWELRVHDNTLTAVAPNDAAVSMKSSYVRLGRGGIASGGTRHAYHYSLIDDDPNRKGHQRLWCRAHYLSASQPYTWMLGIDDRRLAGVALPLDLGFMGGKGNTLYIAPIASLGGATDKLGDIDTSQTGYLSFPVNPDLAGASIFTQIVAADMGNAAFPMVLTDYCKVTFPRPTNACRIFAEGDDTVSTGKLDTTMVLVTRFTWQ